MSYNTDVNTAPQQIAITVNGSQTVTLMPATTKVGMHAILGCLTVVTANALAGVTVSVNYTRNGVACSEKWNSGVALSLSTAGSSTSKVCCVSPDLGTAITMTMVYTGLTGTFVMDACVKPPR